MKIVLLTLSLMLTTTWSITAQELTPPESRTTFIKNLRLFEGNTSEAEGTERKDEMETDRDSFTPATTTAGKCRLIIESGWTYTDKNGFKEANSFPEALLRYGLTERLELRLGANYEVGGVPHDPNELERESNIAYGLKYRLTEADHWMPGSAFIVQASTPTSGNTTNTQLASTYVFGWELPHGIKLDAAFRYFMFVEGSDHFNEWAPSVVLKVPDGERINIHAEYFGLFTTNREENFNHQFFSPGVHYLITENLEVGVRLGWGLNDQTPKFFSNVGVGIRF